MYVSYFLSLHPSAFHYTPPTNPSLWPCPSPQLHLTLSAFHACSLLFTPLSAGTLSSEQEWRCWAEAEMEMWKGREGERREKVAEKWKGKGRSPRSGSSKERNKYASFLYQFSATFFTLHSTIHSTLAPPSLPLTEKQWKAFTLHCLRQIALVHPMYALQWHCCFWIMSKENFPQKVDRLFTLFDHLNWTSK